MYTLNVLELVLTSKFYHILGPINILHSCPPTTLLYNEGGEVLAKRNVDFDCCIMKEVKYCRK